MRFDIWLNQWNTNAPNRWFFSLEMIVYDGLKSIATIYREPTALKFSGTEIMVGGAIFNRAISGECNSPHPKIPGASVSHTISDRFSKP
jgi:hypothetical protein